MVVRRRLIRPAFSPFSSITKNIYFRLFHQKNEVDLPFPKKLDKIWTMQSSFFLAVVGYWGKMLISYGNNLHIYNHDEFLRHFKRKPGIPLLTFCNHHSMLDDPALVAALVENKTMYRSRQMRWVFGAKEIIFSNPIFTYICSRGKVIPTIRGNGVYQPAVNFALKHLNNGCWVHIFPEAKVTLEPIRLKWGIGRLIGECTQTPIVLPFWHVGMDDVLPCTTPLIPRLFKRVTVLFGEPIVVDHLVKKYRDENLSEATTREHLTNLMQEHLYKLKPEAERLHASRTS